MRHAINYAVWIIFLLYNTLAIAQTGCAFDDIREDLMEGEENYMQEIQTMEQAILERLYAQPPSGDVEGYELGSDTVTYTIPVVMHIVHRSGLSYGEEEYLSIEDATAFLDYLNYNFSGQNSTDSPNPFEGVDVGIRFCFAARNPAGQATNGIEYHEDDILTYDTVSGKGGPVMATYQWNPYDYLNIYVVRDISGGYYAYSNLAKEVGEPHDGIVVEYDIVPETWAHEAGHYLNLYHTFEDGSSSSCASNQDCRYDGDLVCDTPPHKKHYGECSSMNTCSNDGDDPSYYNPFRSVSDGGLGDQDDPVYNFMSYDCKGNFTEGQRKRMRDALVYIRQSLLVSEACVPTNSNHDAAITSILSPNGLSCANTITPKFELQNYGLQNLQSVTVEVLLDGVFQYNYDWSGNLIHDAVTEVALPSINIDDTPHVLCILLSNPNGQTDAYTTNDVKLQDVLLVNPIALTTNAACEVVTYEHTGEDFSGVYPPPCDNYQGGDMWFSTQVPASGHVIVEGFPIDVINGAMAVYSGSCDELEYIECNSNDGPDYMPKVEAYGLTPNSTIYIRFWEKSNNVFGDFGICAYDGTGQVTDYEITDVRMSTDTVSSYSGIWFEYVLSNNGSVPSQTFDVGWFLSEDEVWDDEDLYLDYETFSNVEVGESIEDGELLYMPNYVWEGDWYLLVVADFFKKDQELSETNNVVATPLFITDVPHQADVVTVQEGVFPAIIPEGGEFIVGSVYTNEGNGLAGSSFLRYYISQDTIWEKSEDIYVGYTWNKIGLYPDQAEFYAKTFNLPALVTQGDWYMLFVSDYYGDVFELEEKNNVGHFPFTVDNTFPITQLTFRVYLEGLYREDLNKMATSYREKDLFPESQPFRNPPFNYDGVEFVEEANLGPNVIDWVLVEARTGTPNTNGDKGTTIVERRAGLLLENGYITDLDGASPLTFYTLTNGGEYYFAVRHCSHLDVMTKEPITADNSVTYKFTTSINQALGTDQQKMLSNGKAAAISGDYDHNGVITQTDFNIWNVKKGDIIEKYSPSDGDANGVINNLDYNLWKVNKGKIGTHELSESY